MDTSRTTQEDLERAAELAVLHAYDVRRPAAGHDYARARREGEIARLERELERSAGRGVSLDVNVGLELTWRALVTVGVEDPRRVKAEPLPADLVAAAFERVARPRMKRLETQPDGGGTRRSLATWKRVERALGGIRETAAQRARRAGIPETPGEDGESIVVPGMRARP